MGVRMLGISYRFVVRMLPKVVVDVLSRAG